MPQTQNLTDGEIRYIIRNGVRLTGMPGWAKPHDEQSDDSWKLVLFIRSLRQLTREEQAQQSALSNSAHYVGSQSYQKCHSQIYEHWRTTPMANVVRDPREHPDAIIPNLATNSVAKFAKDDVALVYGSLWKQRYFTKRGDDYFPEPVQWDVTHRVWRPYFVAKGTDWWEPFYPPDNMQRPTGPTCDGCHSVDYNIHTKQVAEWNVGCEKCHGPGSEHVEHPSRGTIRIDGKQLHRLSHAENRNDNCEREGTSAYVCLHHAHDDRQIQDSESLHHVPRGQNHSQVGV